MSARYRAQLLRPLLILLLLVVPLATASADPPAAAAAAVISNFDDTLLSVMKNAKNLGYDGRYEALAPTINRTFDIPFMTRVVVGPAWATLPADQRTEVTKAFEKLIVSTYARRFDGYGGETFKIDDTRPVAPGMLVDTRIIRPTDAPVTLNYLMRVGDDGQYKVVDVFLTGTISELATRRSEFGAILKNDGFDGLIAALAKKSDEPGAAKPVLH